MFKTEEINNQIIVSFVNQKRLNIVIANKVKKYLSQIVSIPNQSIVLNLAGISFIDSEGFETLSYILKIAQFNNCNFVLSNICKDVKELFELKNMTNTFRVVDISSFFEVVLV